MDVIKDSGWGCQQGNTFEIILANSKLFIEPNMQDYEKLGAFYLGREFDQDKREKTDLDILYDSRDLTTHAVVVGMTGSGKTGLCIGLLEEAGIDHIPAIVIDPKGDIANLLLTFPNLSPEEFRPWIDEGQAARAGNPEPRRSGLQRFVQHRDMVSRSLADRTRQSPRVGRTRRRLAKPLEFVDEPPDGSKFVPPPAILKSRTNYRSWDRDLKAHVFDTQKLPLLRCLEPKPN